MKKTIFFELNEVPFRVMDEFCNRRPQSTLAKVRPHCHEYKTYAKDTNTLEPWITWPSVHRGVANQQHQIHDYNQPLDEVDQNYPPIWKILHNHGVKTGVFASLHSYPLPENFSGYEFYIPDPFAEKSDCHPAVISDFQKFNLMMSRISGKNVSSKILLEPAANLLLKAGQLGLKLSTFLEIGKQVAHERINPKVVVRRRTYQSVLAFDVFMMLVERQQPEFTTFFTNHVASAMHRYWAATFPEDYPADTLDLSWQQAYSNEIDFAMQKFDVFLQRLIHFVDQNHNYQIIILGSMGQQATKLPHYTKSVVKISDLSKFMQAIGLEKEDWQVKPAMVPQVNLVIADDKVILFRNALESFSIDGQAIQYREATSGFFSLDFSFPDVQSNQVTFLDHTYDFSKVGLENEQLQDGVRVSGWHTPEGAMLIYDPQTQHGNKNKKVSTLAICPSLLENYGVPIPDYMTNERIDEVAA
jgi:hypothetical protein